MHDQTTLGFYAANRTNHHHNEAHIFTGQGNREHERINIIFLYFYSARKISVQIISKYTAIALIALKGSSILYNTMMMIIGRSSQPVAVKLFCHGGYIADF